MKVLGKDTEHVFEVQCLAPRQLGAVETFWIPAFRCLVDGKETLLHPSVMDTFLGMHEDVRIWTTQPKLVKIDDIAHLLTPAQLASMKQP